MIRAAQFFRIPFGWAVKKHIFNHFCGGETLDECIPVIERMGGAGVFSIPDYSAEGLKTREGMAENFEEIKRIILFASENIHVPFAVFKPTSLISGTIAEKVTMGIALNVEEEKDFALFGERVRSLTNMCLAHKVMLLVDAEDYCYQGAFDGVTDRLMEEFNREWPVIFNTVQMYRTDRLEYVEKRIADAKEKKYIAALKLVRGAYMEKERKRAIAGDYPSPIYPDKLSTDAAYDRAASLVIANLENTAVFAGTHNAQSITNILHEMKEKGIARDHSRIWFSQLYGMGDHLTFNLAAAGYRASKYLPYGPVKLVMPYLMRRAEENSSVKGQTGRELSLIIQEIKRRKNDNIRQS
jgi:proline dehydrogenase